MIIDIHAHIMGVWASSGYIEKVFEVAGRFDIQRLCISMGRWCDMQGDINHIRQSNDFVLGLMKDWPDRVVGYCYLNPNLGKENCLGELNRCFDAGMRGIKLWMACACNEPQVFPIVERAIDLGIPILQHTWKVTLGNESYHTEPRQLAELARRYPEVNLIMAHSGGNWQYGIKAVRNCPNITIDVSGGNPTQGWVEMALRQLGPKRIAFGSDAVGRSFASQLAKVDSVAMPKRWRQLIMCDNARRLLGI